MAAQLGKLAGSLGNSMLESGDGFLGGIDGIMNPKQVTDSQGNEFDPSNMDFDPTVGGLMGTGAGAKKSDPTPDAPSSIEKGIEKYKKMGGQVGGVPASKNQRMVALSQYKDMSNNSGLAGLMNMMPKQQQQQQIQRAPSGSRIDKRLQSLMM